MISSNNCNFNLDWFINNMEYLVEQGYIGLFVASFLAATILSFSSEIVLGLLLITNDYNTALLVGIATTGNVLGSIVNYIIGFYGSKFLIRKVIRVSEDEFDKAKHRFKKYGIFSLLLAWVPIIGDPLTVVAGALRINLLLFLILVTAGKLIRYIIISYAIF